MITRRHLLGASAGLLILSLLGAGAAGCDHSAGRQLGPTSTVTPNLIVTNHSPNTLVVYVDGGDIGRVGPQDRGYFQILSGVRRVELREVGHSEVFSAGELHFGFDDVRVSYRP